MATIYISKQDLARLGGVSPLEEQIQIEIVEWLRTLHPWLHVHHVPNGGKRPMRVAKDLKALGVVPGVSDLALTGPGRRQGYMEVKRPGGRTSAAQRQWRAWLAYCDIPHGEVRSVAEAASLLYVWGWTDSDAVEGFAPVTAPPVRS